MSSQTFESSFGSIWCETILAQINMDNAGAYLDFSQNFINSFVSEIILAQIDIDYIAFHC